MKGRNHRFALVVVGLVWLAFALRVGSLTAQSLWRDEVDALRFATQGLAGLLEMFRRPGDNGPMFFLALRPWLQITGTSEFALRFPSAALSALAVPIIYALARRLTRDRIVAALAALLMATAPYAVWYGQEAKMYAWLTVLVPLALYLAIRASWQGGWWRWLLLYMVTSLALYTHLLAALALPVQAIWLLFLPSFAQHGHAGRWANRRRLAGLLYLALLILPYLPLVQWQAPMWLAGDQQTGYPFVPLPTILLVMLVAFTRGILPVTEPLTLLPALLALLAGVTLWAVLPDPELARSDREASHSKTSQSGTPAGDVALPRRLRWGAVVLLVTWFVLPALGIYAITLRRPLFADRYLIWTLPAFLTLLAMGVVTLARVWKPLGLLSCGALLALNLVGVWEQATQPIKSDFRAAAQYVTARQRGELLVFQIPHGRYTFAYYYGEPDGWLDGPYTNNGMSQADLDAEMSRGTYGVSALWLIASEAPMWDERNLTEAWLKAHGTVTERADFARVSVTRFEFK